MLEWNELGPNIEDLTNSEQWRVTAMLFGRHGNLVPIQLVDSELQLEGESSRLIVCPNIILKRTR